MVIEKYLQYRLIMRLRMENTAGADLSSVDQYLISL